MNLPSLKNNSAASVRRIVEQSKDDLLLLAVLFFTKLILVLHVILSGFRMLMNDEPVRYQMSLAWMRDPYFAPWDHVWLGGYFALVGSYMELFGSSYPSVKLLAILTSLAGIAGAYYLCKHLFDSRFAGFVGGLFLAGGHVHTWLSATLMPGIFVIAFTLCGAAFFLWGLKRERNWGLLLGSALIGLSCSFRYEQWIMTALFDVVLLVLVLTRRIRVWVFIACGALSAWYVLAWMLSSWIRYDDPMHFLRSAVAVTEQPEGNPFWVMWQEIRFWERLSFVLGFIGLVLCSVFGNKYQRVYALWVITFSILFPLSMKVGTAMSTWRIIQGWRAIVVMAIPAIAMIPALWIHKVELRRWAAVAIVAGCFVFVAEQSSRAKVLPMWEFQSANLAMAEWVLHEKENPKAFAKYYRPEVFYLSRGPNLGEGEAYGIIAYLSQYKRVRFGTEYNKKDPPEFIITRSEKDMPGYHLIGYMQDFRIWEIGAAEPQ
jgi:hypothetical protein